MFRRICVFSGGRAEYGLLKPLLDELKDCSDVELKILVSGTHLSREFGLTYKEIERDGFICDEKVEMILSSDTSISVCKSMGLGMIGFSEALTRIKPDLLVILGDRFESMAVATTAVICRIPIAHIQGGEKTLGAFDEYIRHSITKMSFLHFVTTNEYFDRVVQLGEHPDRVFNFGAINVDAMKKVRILTKVKLEKAIGFSLGERSLLVTYHPVTLENGTAEESFMQILEAIRSFDNLRVVFTKTNADTEGRVINKLIDQYVDDNQNNAISFTSMGQLHYINALRYVSAVAGNSSSGIIETPTFKVPTVNIGDREKGRVIADNVINCDQNVKSIREALTTVLSIQFKKSLHKMSNPYEQGSTAKKISCILQDHKIPKTTKKEFYDV